MICSNCQTVNAEDANFCLNCNTRISVNCPRCSRRVMSYARFCDACGFELGVQGIVDTSLSERRPARQASPATAPQELIEIQSAEKIKTIQEEQASVLQPSESQVRQAVDEPVEDQSPAVESPLAQYIPAELAR